MFNDNKQYLLNLIEKLQNGNASEEELFHLINFFNSHQNSAEWPLAPEAKNEIKQLIFKRIKEKTTVTNNKSKVIKLNIKRFLQYASIILILVAIVYYFVSNDRFSNSEQNQKVVFNNDIEIGTDKATLTLENGEQIALEKGKSYVLNTLKSDGEKLIYDKAEIDQAAETNIAYNNLTIPRGGKFYLELGDGTKVWLNSESKLKYPVAFVRGKAREIELLYGEAFLSVAPSAMNNGSVFKLKTSKQTIEVLGTEFNIKAYQNDNYIATTLIEGKVNVSTQSYTKTLVPSQQSLFHLESETFTLKTVDVASETSWLKGYFSFTDMEFAEVTKVLSRWYDVEFNFENVELSKLKINGVLRKNQNIEHILITLKNLENIQYNIHGKTINIK